MKHLILALLVLQTSCVGYGTWTEKGTQMHNDRINAERAQEIANQTPEVRAYNEGAAHGCDSGSNATGDWTKKFQKNVDQYIKNPYYKNGWDDGFAKCKGNGELINSVINKSL